MKTFQGKNVLPARNHPDVGINKGSYTEKFVYLNRSDD